MPWLRAVVLQFGLSLTLLGLFPTVHAALAQAARRDLITFTGGGSINSAGDLLTGVLMRPQGSGPFPAIVALHGCGGLYARNGVALSGRHQDWADRWVAAGFAVLFPDSFSGRGVKEICTQHTREIAPMSRSDDARAALIWLAQQSDIDSSKVTLIGWSHGAMTLLWTLRPGFLDGAPALRQAIAFYPGCREIARLAGWRPTFPLTLLIGALDDWTEPKPCEELARRERFDFVSYPNAYHDFDAPNAPVRVRKGLGRVPGGAAHVGTNPEARAQAISLVASLLAR